MDFHQALNIVVAELTPQPWDFTDSTGTTLTVIPAGMPADPGEAKVMIRITRPDATGLAEYGITGPNSRGVAETGIPTADMPGLLEALDNRTAWEHVTLTSDTLTVIPDGDELALTVTETHDGPVREVAAATRIPAAQRMPLASALRRAFDVARAWED
ncbi:hypothetical protein [Streptomyces sp. NPDC005322]|uniref:hypothetical protein n=1 Tax=Streptomyces sp. NPDC005322 TaxID=3157032 RepID=UPI00339FF2B1